MKKTVVLSLLVTTGLIASGYKIPETSTNSVALCAANIAHNHENADAAFYNPAKMVFMEDKNNLEIDAMYIGLDPVQYDGKVGAGTYTLESKRENYLVPSLHYVSSKLGNTQTRFGLSIVSPGGLAKQWQEYPGTFYAEKFSLTTIEVNPSLAFKISDKLAIGLGFCAVYSEGAVKNSNETNTIVRDMTGDSFDFGYNLALAYKPAENLELGITYRSELDLTLEGNAKIDYLTDHYNGYVGANLPLPAALAAAVAYTLPSKTTFELSYERTYWSTMKSLTFQYDATVPATINTLFGQAVPKKWRDTNTFRLGVTQQLDTWTLMGGIVLDQSAAPDNTVSFELPDTSTTGVSLGGRYKVDDNVDVGIAALYALRQSRDAKSTSLDGEFSDGNVILISAGLGYKF